MATKYLDYTGLSYFYSKLKIANNCNKPISNEMIDELLSRDNIVHERISDSEIDDLCDRNDLKPNEFPICEFAMTTEDIDSIMVD